MAAPSSGPITLFPRYVTPPVLGRRSPAIMRKSVDLPDPERPNSPTISPLRKVRLTSSRTLTPGPPWRANSRDTHSTFRMASPDATVMGLFMGFSLVEAQAVFGVAIKRPPQEAVEQRDD